MRIKALGHACFLLETKAGTRIITDPFDASVGYDVPRLQANIVTASHGHYDHGNVDAVIGAKHILTTECDVTLGDVHVYAVPCFHDTERGALRGGNLIFVFEADNVRVAHLGDLGHVLSDEQIEKLGALDAVMIPVGGTFTLDAEDAKALCDRLNVKKILPMHYQTERLMLGKELACLEAFTGQFEQVEYASDDMEICTDMIAGVWVPKLP